MKLLFDGDVIAYRCAFAEKDSPEEVALLKTDELISQIVEAVDPWATPADWLFFLTGPGNFRNDVAKTLPYKGNRKDKEKPKHLGVIRRHLIGRYGAILTQGYEADDAIGIHANYFGYDNVVIISIDKDFDQIPTRIFNPYKWEMRQIDPWSATKSFYKQILIGDRVDNIQGLDGIGPVKAEKLLSGCDDEKALYNTCLEAYGNDKDRVLENGRLLWIQRHLNELWEPPK